MISITLLSDFGLTDASVGITKGILMQHTDLPVVDISHMVARYHLQQAAYLLASSYRHFSKGSFHLTMIDVFSEPAPRLLLVLKDDHYFFAPDNGILPLAFRNAPLKAWKCFELTDEVSFKDGLHACASVIAQLHNSGLDGLQLEECDLLHAPQRWQPIADNKEVECHIIHIDRYENVVVNITKDELEQLAKGRRFKIRFTRNEEISEISAHYNAVKESQKLCRFTNQGYLEIAINHGEAASLFGLQMSTQHQIVYNTIKIIFE